MVDGLARPGTGTYLFSSIHPPPLGGLPVASATPTSNTSKKNTSTSMSPASTRGRGLTWKITVAAIAVQVRSMLHFRAWLPLACDAFRVS